MAAPRLTDADIPRISRCLEDGHTVKQIADQLGVSRGGLSMFMHRRGISVRGKPQVFTEDEIEEVRAALRAGRSMTSIAEDYGCSRSSVARLIAREALDYSRRAVRSASVRKRVATMTKDEQIEYLLEVVELLSPAQDQEQLMTLFAHMRPYEAKILIALWSHKGRAVSRDRLSLDIQVGADDPPAPASMDTYVCTLRKRLLELGWPIEIKTIRGLGYALVRHDPDWMPPA